MKTEIGSNLSLTLWLVVLAVALSTIVITLAKRYFKTQETEIEGNGLPVLVSAILIAVLTMLKAMYSSLNQLIQLMAMQNQKDNVLMEVAKLTGIYLVVILVSLFVSIILSGWLYKRYYNISLKEGILNKNYVDALLPAAFIIGMSLLIAECLPSVFDALLPQLETPRFF